jgi:SNF2 family DNA or RNA helicase
MNELKEKLKENGFKNYHSKSKIELEKLWTNFEITGKVPLAYKSLQAIGEHCQKNNDCKSKSCIKKVCMYNKNAKIMYKPLPIMKKLKLGKNDVNSNCIENMKINMKEHQKKVASFLRDTNRKGLLLMHSVGSGKTLTSIISAKCILSKNPTMKVVVLTPSSVKKQFASEIDKLGLSKAMRSRFDVYSHQTWLSRFKSKQVNAKRTVLIVDEAHRFKKIFKESKSNHLPNKGTYPYLLANAAKESFKIILLSATPIENNIKEMSNYLAMINGNTLTKEYENLKHKFENTNKKEKLNNSYDSLLKCTTSYFMNKDFNVDFPKKEIINVDINMTPEYQDEYMQVESEIFKNAALETLFRRKDNMPDLKKFLSGIRRSVNGLIAPSPKITWVLKTIDDHIQQNKKLLIYSTWLNSGINLINSELQNKNITYFDINGSTTTKDRFKYVQDFNANKRNVIIITSAGAEGLDLKGTSSVIIMEPFWNMTRIEQVIGRAVRYKSHAHLPEKERIVKVYNLILKKIKVNGKIPGTPMTADEILFLKAKQKEKIIDQFVNQIKRNSIETNDCS